MKAEGEGRVAFVGVSKVLEGRLAREGSGVRREVEGRVPSFKMFVMKLSLPNKNESSLSERKT